MGLGVFATSGLEGLRAGWGWEIIEILKLWKPALEAQRFGGRGGTVLLYSFAVRSSQL